MSTTDAEMQLIVSGIRTVKTALQAMSPVDDEDYIRLFKDLIVLERQRQQLKTAIADQTPRKS